MALATFRLKQYAKIKVSIVHIVLVLEILVSIGTCYSNDIVTFCKCEL